MDAGNEIRYPPHLFLRDQITPRAHAGIANAVMHSSVSFGWRDLNVLLPKLWNARIEPLRSPRACAGAVAVAARAIVALEAQAFQQRGLIVRRYRIGQSGCTTVQRGRKRLSPHAYLPTWRIRDAVALEASAERKRNDGRWRQQEADDEGHDQTPTGPALSHRSLQRSLAVFCGHVCVGAFDHLAQHCLIDVG